MDSKIKHLEFILSVIGRMSNHSAALKSFCLALVAGALGLASSFGSSQILIYLLPVAIVFAGLDAQYLNLERGFRRSYDKIRLDKSTEPDFAIQPIDTGFFGWARSIFSWSVLGFYVAVCVVLIFVYFL